MVAMMLVTKHLPRKKRIDTFFRVDTNLYISFLNQRERATKKAGKSRVGKS